MSVIGLNVTHFVIMQLVLSLNYSPIISIILKNGHLPKIVGLKEVQQ